MSASADCAGRVARTFLFRPPPDHSHRSGCSYKHEQGSNPSVAPLILIITSTSLPQRFIYQHNMVTKTVKLGSTGEVVAKTAHGLMMMTGAPCTRTTTMVSVSHAHRARKDGPAVVHRTALHTTALRRTRQAPVYAPSDPSRQTWAPMGQTPLRNTCHVSRTNAAIPLPTYPTLDHLHWRTLAPTASDPPPRPRQLPPPPLPSQPPRQ
ncbi:hypothetical protein FA95DRAFT_255013 [Auriscalpium vulgare]|uniref:Uncharacterized protein n=1 Tax=Auriscalpium vulgare TaxID=40419 RepID=A0ACB8RK39_9AGAM|nr:hypothetical protein FA95DRAFT_255013 [Auriscalpium vulgare]